MSREFIIPQKVITGKNAVESAEAVFKSSGTKAFIVTGPHVVQLECFKKVTDMLKKLGIGYAVFSGITGEPDDKMIDEGLKMFIAENCDFLIGIGGGSPLDSIKAIGALSVSGGRISDYMGKNITVTLPAMIAIPTTAGTGSEATKFTVITDSEKGIKMLLKGDNLVPDAAIIDPEFSASSPRSVTASTGLDALTHAVESYTSKLAQPLTDSAAISAVKRIFKYLPRAYKDGKDMEARSEMAIAAFEAGTAINNASVTVVHGMSRPIGALFHVPHGLSNAMLLEKCMRFAVSGAPERFAELAKAIGCSGPDDDPLTAANKFADALGEICSVCEVPTLKEYGIDKQEFFEKMDKMAEDALASGSPGNTMRTVTKEDIKAIYRSLWD